MRLLAILYTTCNIQSEIIPIQANLKLLPNTYRTNTYRTLHLQKNVLSCLGYSHQYEKKKQVLFVKAPSSLNQKPMRSHLHSRITLQKLLKQLNVFATLNEDKKISYGTKCSTIPGLLLLHSSTQNKYAHFSMSYNINMVYEGVEVNIGFTICVKVAYLSSLRNSGPPRRMSTSCKMDEDKHIAKEYVPK